MSYRLLGPALDDLDAIDSWVASNFGEAAATRVRRKLSETFALLATFQKMGVERPDVTGRSVRFFASPPNWIVYEPGSPLLIHHVYPAALDIEIIKL